MPSPLADHRVLTRHFRKADPVIAEVIRQVGPFSLQLERNRFGMLVRSITSQQISTKAARAIRLRLEQLVAPARITPESIAALSLDELRSIGLSQQKASYVHDLAAKTFDGTVRLASIGRLDDDAIIDQLTQVRGIGRWTAQMFLIFALGRLDVFPHDDFGVRSAIRQLYGLPELPRRAESLAIGARWTPYATIASWYCWRSLDLAKQQTPEAGFPS